MLIAFMTQYVSKKIKFITILNIILSYFAKIAIFAAITKKR